jgi:LmbE family N-acetylglucosaminyl deacetylase
MKTVLCVGAHPDDIEIGCGGTVAKLYQEGYAVHCVVVTSGDAGSQTIDQTTLASIREAESQKALTILGAKDVDFLREKDGLVAVSYNLKIKLIEIIRQIKPDILFTHARSDHFSDHELVSKVCDMAIRAAAGPWYQEVKEAPHQISEIYGYEVWHPINQHQLAVNIETTLETKLASLRCHTSQLKDIAYDEAVRGLASYRGVTSMAGKYAEVFEVWKTSLSVVI